MSMRSRLRSISSFVGCVALLFFSAGPLSAQDGPILYKRLCASCHDTGLERAPDRDALRAMSPERVLAALESGPMLSMASNRTGVERRAIAEFVTGKSFAQALSTTPSPQAMCRATEGGFRRSAGGTALERVGREHGEHALSGWSDGRIHRGRGASSAAQMGLRLSGRAQLRLAAHGCRRPRLRRDPERHRLFAQRVDRLRALVFSGRVGGARGHQPRPYRHWLRTTLRRVHWRPRRQYVCRRCRNRGATVDNESGRFPVRPGHRRPGVA